MQIVVNGDDMDVPAGTTVRQLLTNLRLTTRAIAVERNLQIVPAAQHAECILAEGDRLEIVSLVGGG